MTLPPETADLLDFIRAAEKLKDTHRSGWTSAGSQDTVAGHSWRICLMVLVLHSSFPEADLARLLELAVLHDLGEAIGGDIPAPKQTGQGDKSAAERSDLVRFLAPLPAALRARFLSRWDEYEAATTLEARLVKALDKLETIIQHNQGKNPPGFDYLFNIEYGRDYTDAFPFLAEIRAELDEETRRRASAD